MSTQAMLHHFLEHAEYGWELVKSNLPNRSGPCLEHTSDPLPPTMKLLAVAAAALLATPAAAAHITVDVLEATRHQPRTTRVIIDAGPLTGDDDATAGLPVLRRVPKNEADPQPETCLMLERQWEVNHTQPHVDDAKKEEIDEEQETQILAEMLQNDASLTLWDIFMLRAHKIGEKIKQTHDKWTMVQDFNAAIIGGTVKWAIRLTLGFFSWMAELLYRPKSWAESIKHYFKQLGQGLKALWHIAMHKPPKYTLEMLGGGILLEITEHPDKFIAQTGLLLVGGFRLIHGVMEGMSLICDGLPPAVATSIKSALIFVHAVDDPLIILANILNVASSTANSAAGGGSGSGNTTSYTLIVPAGLNLDDKVPEWPTCKLPPPAAGYQLRYGTFCNLTRERAQEILFGTDRDPQALGDAELVEAQKKFHDFVCCYGPLKHTPPGLENDPNWQNVSVTLHDCDTLRGTYRYGGS
ncbi:hypothetical protein P8C59_007711 [Phyllachora maydis]|uniref:Uncharacterized protein n=1 Tax=Phyllachora maydis TaxID=1825666 RepID=A0AAD9MIN8_9PEZI|nr:hypothetical protein P8C59_007711 [Phyllachora maydis]